MTPAIELLRKAKEEFHLHSYRHDPAADSYGQEAVEKLGLEAGRVFKTLLVVTDQNELLTAVVPVAGQLDLKVLARVGGAKRVEMADPQVAQRVTGYQLGGISPLGQKRCLRTFIDKSAQGYPTIYISAGRRGLEIELSAVSLARHTRGIFADLGRFA